MPYNCKYPPEKVARYFRPVQHGGGLGYPGVGDRRGANGSPAGQRPCPPSPLGAQADEAWRASGRSPESNAAFLQAVREHYETEFPSWDVWTPFRRLVEKVNLNVCQVDFANLAKCRQRTGPSPDPLIRFCQRDFPMTDVVEAIRPRAVLVASSMVALEETLESSGAPLTATRTYGRSAPQRSERRCRWRREWERKVVAELSSRLRSS
jgi:hypothetical protein